MYNCLKEMISETQKNNMDLAELIITNETKRFDYSREEVLNIMKERWQIMAKSTKTAIEEESTLKRTFISGMAVKQNDYRKKDNSLCGDFLNKVMARALSCSEVNAAMGKICAMPTAGSCGIVPAVIESLGEELNLTEEEIINGYIVASGTGAIVVENATVSGAEGGCQAECGVAAAMAAAAAVYLKGGTPEESVEAFSFALINVMGLVCDPVAGLVQIPCAQRNASQAINALLSADMAMAGNKCGIDPDEVIESMYRVGKLMPVQHRETSLGGIAVTDSGKAYEVKLKDM